MSEPPNPKPAPEAEPSGSFRWNPFVGIMIGVVLLMLALPLAMVGWFLRGVHEERIRENAAEVAASGVEGSEGEDDLLRAALENAMKDWQPATVLDFPEVVITASEVGVVREKLQHWADQSGVILIQSEAVKGEEGEGYLLQTDGEKWEGLFAVLEKYLSDFKILNNVKNIKDQNIIIKITIKSEI